MNSRGFLAVFFGCLLLASSPEGRAEVPVSAPAPVRRARVVKVHDPAAVQAFRPNLEVIRTMVDRALTNLTGKATVPEAWRSLVSTQDVVGLKVYSVLGPNSGTRPTVVAALVEGLLAAGLPPTNIVVWDKQTIDLRLAGFFDLAEHYGVRVTGSAQSGYDSIHSYDTPLLGNLVWGDLEFGRKGSGVGRKSHVSNLVSRELTKIINVTPMLNHNSAGVAGNLYSLAVGSVDNVARFDSDPFRLATAIPEIYALPELSDKVVLNVVDALVCQYDGSERGRLDYSATLNQLRFSTDPVALDALSLQEITRLRHSASAASIKPNLDLYSNAALLELGINDLKRIQVDTID